MLEPLAPLSDAEQRGRMYECIDIQRAIESGQLKTLDEVLEAVQRRAESIDAELYASKVTPITVTQ